MAGCDKYLPTFDTFLFRSKFAGLTNEEFQLSVGIIAADFSDIYKLWEMCEWGTRYRKVFLLYNYLIGWSLMSLHPGKVVGIDSMGSIPLTSKAIGDVRLGYASSVRQEGGLIDLQSNYFGIEALRMLQNAPENFKLYG